MKLSSFIILSFCLGATSVIAEESNSTHSQEINPQAHPKHKLITQSEAERINPIKKEPESIARGRKLYVKSCANCHGNSANGNGPAAKKLQSKPTNLREMAGHHSDGELAWKILNSRGAMPAWKNMLGTNQIWDLVNYIQSLKIERKKKNNDE